MNLSFKTVYSFQQKSRIVDAAYIRLSRIDTHRQQNDTVNDISKDKTLNEKSSECPKARTTKNKSKTRNVRLLYQLYDLRCFPLFSFDSTVY